MYHQHNNSNKSSNRRWTTTYSCSNQSCRDKNRFEADRILTRYVKNNRGGTQNQFGFFCRKCSVFTPIHQATMPPKIVLLVKNESDWLQAKASKTAYYYGSRPQIDENSWIKGPKGRFIIEQAFAAVKNCGKIVGVKHDNGENKRTRLNLTDVNAQNILEYLEHTCFFIISIAYIDNENRLNRIVIDNQRGALVL